MASIIRIAPYEYIHVLNKNTNVTRIEQGPKTYTRKEQENVVLGPEGMVTIPPRCYVQILDPVQLDEDSGNIVKDENGTILLQYGETEIRLHDDYKEPFPLYPGESIANKLEELPVLEANQAFHIKAVRNFTDSDGKQRSAGDEWLFEGPATYIPRIEEEVLIKVHAVVIKPDTAIRLEAHRQMTDRNGVAREAGQQWLERKVGAYMPNVDEIIKDKCVRARVLTDKTALHVQAIKSFTDLYGEKRKAGDEWLVTSDMAETHIPSVNENVIGEVAITTLTNRQFCVVLNPYDKNGVQHLGYREQRKGECSFFLQPGETLADGVQNIHVLSEEEALLVRAQSTFGESDDETHTAGEVWMVHGPCEYIPPVEVEVITPPENASSRSAIRRAIPLDDNEGVYVRNIRSGEVRMVVGQTYMLKPNEELYAKKLPDEVDNLLAKQALGSGYVVPTTQKRGRAAKPKVKRDETRAVTFRVPHNAAVQVFDFKTKESRVVFGPELVMLGPDEQFTVMRLSGDKPKRPNVITSLTLMLGPDFMTDIITVETSDHARLNLTVAYNWQFDVSAKLSKEDQSRIFAVRDFTGDACKALASRIRAAVACETFDNFHKYSARVIRGSIFGMNADTGKIKDEYRFDANRLVVTNVDVQSVEPVDPRTRESLQASVQLAIEISTRSQESRATHQARKEEEIAKGNLTVQRLKNKASAEKTRKELLELEGESKAVQAEGAATAEAHARAEAQQIEADASVRMARARAKAMEIEATAKLNQLKAQQDATIRHQKQLNDLEVEKVRKLAEIEADKFSQTVEAIGKGTITEIARAGPEMQAKLLKGLGLKGFLVTDGKNPINLFQTAKGMIHTGGNPVIQEVP